MQEFMSNHPHDDKLIPAALAGFKQVCFTHEDHSFPIYRYGQGPAVLVIHEIPGLTPAVIEFARRVGDAGFTVILPVLFGEIGRGYEPLYTLKTLAMTCIRKEFAVFAARQSSPVSDYLRALCRAVHAHCGGHGVGVVGMCLTGNFALSLMVDPVVMAPVLSQPSLPIGLTHRAKAALHISDDELALIKKRVATEDLKILGLRFTHDPMCPKARFDRLKDEFGAGFEAIEIDSSLGNPNKVSIMSHSVLTKDLIDKQGHPTQVALHRTLAFLHEQLDY